jgi:hypothetical protein
LTDGKIGEITNKIYKEGSMCKQASKKVSEEENESKKRTRPREKRGERKQEKRYSKVADEALQTKGDRKKGMNLPIK